MQPSRHKAQSTYARAARVVAALALVLVLLSGIAPLGSLASVSVSACSMSCCIGLPPHAAGECAGVSCHVELAGQNASTNNTHGETHDAHGEAHDQHNAAGSQEIAVTVLHQHEPKPQPLRAHDNDASHASHVEETHSAETLQASQPSATTDAGHAAGSKTKPERRPSVARASLANPCPSECGMAAGNATNNVRPRDAAMLNASHRPRPPAPLASSKHSSTHPLASAGKHRLAPPRAPPLAL